MYKEEKNEENSKGETVAMCKVSQSAGQMPSMGDQFWISPDVEVLGHGRRGSAFLSGKEAFFPASALQKGAVLFCL